MGCFKKEVNKQEDEQRAQGRGGGRPGEQSVFVSISVFDGNIWVLPELVYLFLNIQLWEVICDRSSKQYSINLN